MLQSDAVAGGEESAMATSPAWQALNGVVLESIDAGKQLGPRTSAVESTGGSAGGGAGGGSWGSWGIGSAASQIPAKIGKCGRCSKGTVQLRAPSLSLCSSSHE